jgi:hypothetical protein
MGHGEPVEKTKTVLLAATLATVVFTVTPLRPLPGNAVDLAPSPCAQTFAATPGAPPTADLAANGTAAFVEHPPYSPDQCGDDLLTVIRANGSRIEIPRPSADAAQSVMRILGSMPHIERVRLAADGTPYITLVAGFSGAYSGLERGLFVWNGRGWQGKSPALPHTDRAWPNNDGIGAVDLPARFTVNADFMNAFGPDSDRLGSDPAYWAPQTGLVSSGRTIPLGDGTSLAVRGRFAAGYRSSYQDAFPPRALRWDGRARVDLGPGIAFGIDADGDAVGQSRTSWKAAPHPVLWHGGRTIRLTDAIGSAYAIRDGTIVGVAAGRGFIVRRDDPRRRVRALDALVGAGWAIDGAYAIAANGRILATGRRHGGPKTLLVLDPSR